MSDEQTATGSDTRDDGGAKNGPTRVRRRADRDTRKLEPQIGRALRTVYDETVGEEIPPEMLELLGKLS